VHIPFPSPGILIAPSVMFKHFRDSSTSDGSERERKE
jgi:hypothetical protein